MCQREKCRISRGANELEAMVGDEGQVVVVGSRAKSSGSSDGCIRGRRRLLDVEEGAEEV